MVSLFFPVLKGSSEKFHELKFSFHEFVQTDGRLAASCFKVEGDKHK